MKLSSGHQSNRVFMEWQPVEDWTTLEGRLVEFHQRGRVLDHGRVDAVTSDGSLVWLQHDGVLPRRIVEKKAGVLAWTY